MSILRGMDKEDVVHIQNGSLLNHKKEPNNIICRKRIDLEIFLLSEVREKQISYSIIHMWNLNKNDANGLINRNRITNVENKLVVTSGAREGDTLGDWD